MRDEEIEQWAVLAATGDAAALDALLAAIRPGVLRRCARLLPCFQDAEEACQDALLQVARTIESNSWSITSSSSTKAVENAIRTARLVPGMVIQ